MPSAATARVKVQLIDLRKRGMVFRLTGDQHVFFR